MDKKAIYGILAVVCIGLIVLNYFMLDMYHNKEEIDEATIEEDISQTDEDTSGDATSDVADTTEVDSDTISETSEDNNSEATDDNSDSENDDGDTTEEAEPEVEKLPTPTILQEPGTYNEAIGVELEALEGTIYYTLDGSVPNENSMVYDIGILVEETVLIHAIAINEEGVASDMVSWKFVVDIPKVELGSYVFRVKTSSTLSETVGGVERVYSVDNLFDYNHQTIWAEGDRGDGSGEWILFETDEPFDLETFSITNGFTYSAKSYLYSENNRALSLTLKGDDDQEIEIQLTDWSMNVETYEVGFEDIKSLKVTFKEIAPGSEYNDLCISEMRLNAQAISIMSN